MALLTTTNLDVTTGAAPAFVAAAAGGDEARCDDRAFAVFKNGHTAAQTVTVVVPGNLPTGDPKTDKAYSVPNGGERWIPLDEVYRGGGSTSERASFTYSGVTLLTVAIVRR